MTIVDNTANARLRIRENTISVYSVEAYVSTNFDKLKEKVLKAALPPNPLRDSLPALIDIRTLMLRIRGVSPRRYYRGRKQK